jgi:hypothetical protein
LVLVNTAIKQYGAFEDCRHRFADMDILLLQLRRAGYGRGRTSRASEILNAHWYVARDLEFDISNMKQVLNARWQFFTNNLISSRL